MKAEFEDSLPNTDEDYRLDHDGFHGMKAWCRVRVYREGEKPVVVVATQPYDVEDSGLNPMNGAETVYPAAWKRAGESWPVFFICHFAGEVGRDHSIREQWTQVRFQSTSDGPVLREDVSVGDMIRFGDDLAVEDRQTRVSHNLGFAEPTWQPLKRREIERMIGKPMPKRRFQVDVEEVTIENSTTERWVAEHFPEG